MRAGTYMEFHPALSQHRTCDSRLIRLLPPGGRAKRPPTKRGTSSSLEGVRVVSRELIEADRLPSRDALDVRRDGAAVTGFEVVDQVQDRVRVERRNAGRDS